MKSKKRTVVIIIWAAVIIALLVSAILIGPSSGEKESIKDVMKDAVLHESNKVSLFGIMDVNPTVVSAFTVTVILLIFAAAVRIFAVPRFKMVPGKFQLMLESLVGLFNGIAKSNSPHRNKFLSAYIFSAGTYIFVGTVFELIGIQAVTTEGRSIAMPAPLSDINGAIAMGVLSYLIILSGGIASNGLHGAGNTLKDFSLPISMSFRLFGALLSGLLVTELVYYYLGLSFVLPIAVGVLFTLLHALIQTYVLIMLTALFYGEVSEPHPKKDKKRKANTASV